MMSHPMFRSNRLLAGLCCLIFDLASRPVTAEDSQASGWMRPGTNWLLHVKQYYPDFALRRATSMPEEVTERRADEFDIRITVLEPRRDNSGVLARFQFAAEANAPEEVRSNGCVLEVDATLGTVGNYPLLLEAGGRRESTLIKSAGERWLLYALAGLPAEWITTPKEISTDSQRASAEGQITSLTDGHYCKTTRRSENEPNGVTVRAGYDVPKSHFSHIVEQTWVPGEPWWREFKRYQSGYIMLEVTRVVDQDSPR